MSKRDLQEKLLKLSEEQGELQDQMNNDRLRVLKLNQEIEQVRAEIKQLQERVKRADGHIDTYRNLIRNRSRAGKRKSVDTEEKSSSSSSEAAG